MKPDKNGVIFIEKSSPEKEYKLWECDRWKCPECGAMFLTGFGKEAFFESFQEGFGGAVQDARNDPDTVTERHWKE